MQRGKRILLSHLLWIAGCFCPLLIQAEGLYWPEGQMLPTFSAPAAKLDCIDVSTLPGPEQQLFVSLEGIVNRSQPRVTCVRDGGEGKFTWLKLHKLHYHRVNGYKAVLKYRNEVTGLVVTDPNEPDTLNLATTMAGVNNELICDPSLLGKLTNAPFHLPVVDDLRGRFAGKLEVYRYLYSNYWSRCTHRIIAGMSPRLRGDLRDYLIAVKAAVVFLGPQHKGEAEVLRLFISDMKPMSGVYMGWWPGEDDGLKWIADYGIPVLASDFFRNATVFSGVSHDIRVPQMPAPPPLENKVYVAMILSDGDNVQYMQHAMKIFWDKPERGSIPIGWTTSPLAVDLDPAMLDYYWSTATTNDCLVSGPSGAGYTRINYWSAANVAAFTRASDSYFKRSGLRVVTVWSKLDSPTACAYATNCPSLLGLTDEAGKYSGVDQGLRTIRLTPDYTSEVPTMIEYITNAAAKWDGTKPLFIAGQANIWHLGPTGLAKVAKALDPKKYTLVRPDQLFALARQADGK